MSAANNNKHNNDFGLVIKVGTNPHLKNKKFREQID